MARKLALVAASGFAIALVCAGAAAAIGAHAFGKGEIALSFLGEPSCTRAGGDGAKSRVINWDGSDQIVLAVPAHVRYTAGSGDVLQVSGDPATIAHIRLRDGHIEMDCRSWYTADHGIDITLPGRTFRKFAILGSGKMMLDGLDQDALKVSITGSGDIRASGRVDRLDVHIAGSGDADLGRVAAATARIHIAGSGTADVAPRDDADIHIAGSGDVNLRSHPARMNTHISGSGRIRNLGDDI